MSTTTAANSIVTRNISANGCIALWELSGVYDLAEVRAAFRSVGLEEIAPRARTSSAALHAALTSIYGRRGVLIRPCGEGAFVVVEDVPVPQELRMERRDVQGARVNADGTLTIRETDGADEIRAKFQTAQGQIDNDALSAALSTAISSLSGMPIRSRGGVYWVPETTAARWRALGSALMALPTRTGTAIGYAVTTVGDEGTIRAISDAFTREADGMMEAVSEELGALTNRSASTRARRLSDLTMKAEHYEEVLGASLAGVRARIAALAAEVGQAAILA